MMYAEADGFVGLYIASPTAYACFTSPAACLNNPAIYLKSVQVNSLSSQVLNLKLPELLINNFAGITQVTKEWCTSLNADGSCAWSSTMPAVTPVPVIPVQPPVVVVDTCALDQWSQKGTFCTYNNLLTVSSDDSNYISEYAFGDGFVGLFIASPETYECFTNAASLPPQSCVGNKDIVLKNVQFSTTNTEIQPFAIAELLINGFANEVTVTSQSCVSIDTNGKCVWQ